MWLYVYAILVAAVVLISITRSLAFFECSFRCALLCPTGKHPECWAISAPLAVSST